MGKNEVLQDWELLLSEISRNGTALNNQSIDFLDKIIRTTDCPAVDVEALKREITTALTGRNDCGLLTDVIRTIDHLASRNLIRGADHVPDTGKMVEPIEGLSEAIEFYNNVPHGANSKLPIILEAATKYNEMMKGDRGWLTE